MQTIKHRIDLIEDYREMDLPICELENRIFYSFDADESDIFWCATSGEYVKLNYYIKKLKPTKELLFIVMKRTYITKLHTHYPTKENYIPVMKLLFYYLFDTKNEYKFLEVLKLLSF